MPATRSTCRSCGAKDPGELTYLETFALCNDYVGGNRPVFCNSHKHLTWDSYWSVERERSSIAQSRYNHAKKAVKEMYEEQQQKDRKRELEALPGRTALYHGYPTDLNEINVKAVCMTCQEIHRTVGEDTGCKVHQALVAATNQMLTDHAKDFQYDLDQLIEVILKPCAQEEWEERSYQDKLLNPAVRTAKEFEYAVRDSHRRPYSGQLPIICLALRALHRQEDIHCRAPLQPPEQRLVWRPDEREGLLHRGRHHHRQLRRRHREHQVSVAQYYF